MGACDSLSRSVTLARFTDAAEELCREATALLRALRVPYTEIRGLGLTVTKLNTESASAGAKPSAFPPAKMVAPPATIVGHAAPVGRTSPIDKLFGKGGQQQAASRSGAVPLPAPIEEEQEDGSGAKKEMEGVEDSEERVVTAVSEKPDVMDVDDGGDSGSDAGWEEGSDDAGVDAHAEEGLSPPVSSAQLPETGVDDEEPASVSRREVLARYEGVTLTQIDAAEFNALPWHIQKELITALPRTRSGIKTAEASAAPDTANEGTASGRNGAEAGGDLDPQSFGPGNCQKSIAPLGEASTRETGAVVSARPMDSLPSLSQLDPLVLDALPLALKREIELAYGIVAPRAPPLKAPAKRTARGQGVRHAARPDAKLRRMDEFVTGQPRQAGLAARGQGGASGSRGVGTGVVTFSQVDPGVLDELPAELRTEIMQQLRPLPRAKAAARGAQRQRAAARAAAEAQEGLHAMRQEDSSDDEDGAGDEGGHEPLSQAFQGLVDSIDAASGLQDALKLLGEALTARECDKSDMVGGSPSQCSGPEGLPATHPSSEGPQGMEDTPQHGWSRVEASLVKLAKPLVASDLEAARRGLMRIQALAKAHAPFAATAQRVSSTLQRRITRRYGFPVSLRTLHKE